MTHERKAIVTHEETTAEKLVSLIHFLDSKAPNEDKIERLMDFGHENKTNERIAVELVVLYDIHK